MPSFGFKLNKLAEEATRNTQIPSHANDNVFCLKTLIKGYHESDQLAAAAFFTFSIDFAWFRREFPYLFRHHKGKVVHKIPTVVLHGDKKLGRMRPSPGKQGYWDLECNVHRGMVVRRNPPWIAVHRVPACAKGFGQGVHHSKGVLLFLRNPNSPEFVIDRIHIVISTANLVPQWSSDGTWHQCFPCKPHLPTTTLRSVPQNRNSFEHTLVNYFEKLDVMCATTRSEDGVVSHPLNSVFRALDTLNATCASVVQSHSAQETKVFTRYGLRLFDYSCATVDLVSSVTGVHSMADGGTLYGYRKVAKLLNGKVGDYCDDIKVNSSSRSGTKQNNNSTKQNSSNIKQNSSSFKQNNISTKQNCSNIKQNNSSTNQNNSSTKQNNISTKQINNSNANEQNYQRIYGPVVLQPTSIGVDISPQYYYGEVVAGLSCSASHTAFGVDKLVWPTQHSISNILRNLQRSTQTPDTTIDYASAGEEALVGSQDSEGESFRDAVVTSDLLADPERPRPPGVVLFLNPEQLATLGQDGALDKSFHQYQGVLGREHVLTHFKSYYRPVWQSSLVAGQRQVEEFEWFLLSSSCLSRGALGFQINEEEYVIRNWELGVLFRSSWQPTCSSNNGCSSGVRLVRWHGLNTRFQSQCNCNGRNCHSTETTVYLPVPFESHKPEPYRDPDPQTGEIGTGSWPITRIPYMHDTTMERFHHLPWHENEAIHINETNQSTNSSHGHEERSEYHMANRPTQHLKRNDIRTFYTIQGDNSPNSYNHHERQVFGLESRQSEQHDDVGSEKLHEINKFNVNSQNRRSYQLNLRKSRTVVYGLCNADGSLISEQRKVTLVQRRRNASGVTLPAVQLLGGRAIRDENTESRSSLENQVQCSFKGSSETTLQEHTRSLTLQEQTALTLQEQTALTLQEQTALTLQEQTALTLQEQTVSTLQEQSVRASQESVSSTVREKYKTASSNATELQGENVTKLGWSITCNASPDLVSQQRNKENTNFASSSSTLPECMKVPEVERAELKRALFSSSTNRVLLPNTSLLQQSPPRQSSQLWSVDKPHQDREVEGYAGCLSATPPQYQLAERSSASCECNETGLQTTPKRVKRVYDTLCELISVNDVTLSQVQELFP